MKYTLFLSCIRGYENICADDLATIGVSQTRVREGGVELSGNLEDIYRINCFSRYGMHLYWEIAEIPFDKNRLSNDICKIDWDRYFNNIHSFAVKVNSRDQKINTQYMALLIKDGVADYFNKKYNKRPNIDRKDPDIPIYAYINNKKIKIYIDTTGEPLYKRGYRSNKAHEAPLNEVLASNIVSNIDTNNKTIYDPMCGSGTLLIELAMKTTNTPSQICRDTFAFMNWFNYDFSLYKKVKDKLKEGIIDADFKFHGSDNDMSSIEMLSYSIEKLELKNKFNIRQRNFYDFIPNPGASIIFNPPYDIRISINKNLDSYYSKIGEALKTKCRDNTIYIFTIENGSIDNIDIPCIDSKQFKNGNLNCLLNTYQI